ncbi:MAG: peptidoglycan DD-metalloendopeptidase family protein [Vicinamibacteraceae bacterium]|nr:peptidoglycan DD-metalloendopeptidase family protein [Vicinamibacteraceae bacterium]
MSHDVAAARATIAGTPARAADAGAGAAERERARQVALEFEALLLSQMFKQMRQSLLDEQEQDEGLGASTLFDTLDVELSRHLAAQGGIGLARMVEEGLRRTGLVGAEAIGSAEAPVGAPTAGSVARPFVTTPGSAVPSVVAPASTSAAPAATAAPATDDVTLHLPFEARTSSAYGWRSDPFHGKSRFHSGIDLAAAYGREVPVAAAGRVTFAGERGAYGQLVVVEHANGVETRYAHLSGIEVTAGQQLALGDVVGRVGQSGRATGPHLHFEVLLNGERVDPGQVARGVAPLKNWAAEADFPIDRDSARRVE